jgi:hypothetical protein
MAHDRTSLSRMPQDTTKRPPRADVPFYPDIHTANKATFVNKRKHWHPARVFKMKYTYDISQWDMYHGCYVMIFCDLDAEAFEQHSAMARCWLTQHHAPMLYISPARRSRRLNFNMFLGDSFMHPGALKYVLCAINRAKNGKRIFFDLPKDFTLSVQVHQVLIFLQVEECIDPMHGHIRQIIRRSLVVSRLLRTNNSRVCSQHVVRAPKAPMVASARNIISETLR